MKPPVPRPRKERPHAGSQATISTLDPHRLDVYAVAVGFHAAAKSLVPHRGWGDARDQLARASLSIVLNIAEACGRPSPRDRARFFAIARGSVFECGAVIDVLERHGEDLGDYRRARALLVRLAQMLTRLLPEGARR